MSANLFSVRGTFKGLTENLCMHVPLQIKTVVLETLCNLSEAMQLDTGGKK